MRLTAASRFVFRDDRLAPLVGVLRDGIHKLTGLALDAAREAARAGDIELHWRETADDPADAAVPYLRFTGELRNEPTRWPESGRTYDDFLSRQRAVDARLDALMSGISWRAEGE